MSSPVRTAVIPAAGFGTRLLPATASVAKELLPLLDRPALAWVAAEARASGIERLILVSSPGKPDLERPFRPAPEMVALLAGRDEARLAEIAEIGRGLTVETVVQTEALGLGHAVLVARDAVGVEPFAVMLPDDIYVGDQPALAALLDAPMSCVGYQTVPREATGRYGIIEWGEGERVSGLVEKPDPAVAPSTSAALGRYRLEAEIFDWLARTPPGAGGEIQLTDALHALASEGRMSARALPGQRYDVGTTGGWLEANLALGLADPRYRERLLALVARGRG